MNLVGGFWGGKSIADTSISEWQAMFDLNLKPTFLCCRAAVPAMKKNGYGRIVSVSSRSGLMGAGDFAAYAIAKGAIATFTASLAEEVLARQHHRQCDRAEHHRHRGESRRDAEGEA